MGSDWEVFGSSDECSLPKGEEVGDRTNGGVVGIDEFLDELDAVDGGAGAVVVHGVDKASFESFEGPHLIAAVDYVGPVDGCSPDDWDLGVVPS